MNIKDLETFITLCDENNFTKTAEKLFISQSSLSKLVQKLEKETGSILLDRTSRKIRITDAGIIFYKKSKEILNMVETMNREIQDLSDDISGIVKIGLPQIIGTVFFSVFAKEFTEKYPKVDLKIVETGGLNVEKMILEETLDLGLCVLPTMHRMLKSEMIYEDDFVVCVPQGHKFAHRSEINIEELQEEKFLLFDKSFALNRLVVNACKDQGFIPDVMFESTQWDFILQMVSYNLGISIVPRILVEKLSGVDIIPIKIKNTHLKWQIGIVTKNDRYQPNTLKKLIEVIHTEFDG